MEQVFRLQALALPWLCSSRWWHQILVTNISATESQAVSLINFTNNNGLKINANKTEVVALSRAKQILNLTFSVAGHQVGTKQEAKWLGYWWKSNLGAGKSTEANIEKRRKAFFAAGAIDAYQGNLNPLSSTSLFHTCVVPTLLYGSENWILTKQTIAIFQSQMGKRILKIPKHYASSLPIVALQLPYMRVQILIRKLHFLAHLLTSNDNTLGPTTFRTLAICNVDDRYQPHPTVLMACERLHPW